MANLLDFINHKAANTTTVESVIASTTSVVFQPQSTLTVVSTLSSRALSGTGSESTSSAVSTTGIHSTLSGSTIIPPSILAAATSSSTSTSTSTSTSGPSSSSIDVPSVLSTQSSSTSSASTLSTSVSTAAASTNPTVPSGTVVPPVAPHHDDGVSAHLPAIIVASLMGAFIIGTVVYLLFMYCPPIRRRIEARKQKQRDDQMYRESMDGTHKPEASQWQFNGPGLGLSSIGSLREQALADALPHPPPPRVSDQQDYPSRPNWNGAKW